MIYFKIKSYPVMINVSNSFKVSIVRDDSLVSVNAEDLKKGDYIYVSKPLLSEQSLLVDLSKYIVDDKFVKRKNRLIYKRDVDVSEGVYNYPLINSDLFYLIGLYLAEGCVYASNDCVSFSFNSNEKDTLVKGCKEIITHVFGLSEEHIYEREYCDRKGIELVVSNTLIGRFFKDIFGAKSVFKFLTKEWKLPSDKEFRKALLRGYWDGDGHVSYRHSNINPEYVATTKSFTLCMCMRDILLSFDIVPSIIMNTRKDGRVSFITSVSSEIMDGIMGVTGTNRCSNNFYSYIFSDGFAIRITDVK